MVKPKKKTTTPRSKQQLVEIDEATFTREKSEEPSRNHQNDSVKLADKSVKRLSSESIAEIEKQVACSEEKDKVEITILEEDNQSIEIEPPSTKRRNKLDSQQRKGKGKPKQAEGDEATSNNDPR